MSYLVRLAVDLAFGAAKIASADRDLHRRFILAAQNSDGGFANREGESDVYYTGFALRGLMLLGGIPDSVSGPLRKFLQSRLASFEEPIDFLSLIFCDLILQTLGEESVFESAEVRREAFEAVLAPLVREDGGYAKTAKSKYGSLYNTFLVIACGELLDIAPPNPTTILRFVRSRLREDGGFAEAAQIRSGGVNPTSAAVALLEIINEEAPELRRAAGEFVQSMWTSEGGLKAAGRIPFADLLSTFTGLLTLRHLSAADGVDRETLARFVDSLRCPDGGFRGGSWDNTPDVEYTFYGVGALALAGC